MLKRGGFPLFLAVALQTITSDLAVEIIGRRFVARFATIAHRGAQKYVRERLATALRQSWGLVIAVTCHAVLLDQFLMKRRFVCFLRNRRTLGCS